LKLKSHLLKTSVMHHVLRQDPEYWNNNNLQTCFVDCIRNLWIGLQKRIIKDIFFPEFNMLDRIADDQVLGNCCTWLDGLIKKHNRTDQISVFFPEMAGVSFGTKVKEIKVTVIGKDSKPSEQDIDIQHRKEKEVLEKEKNEHKEIRKLESYKQNVAMEGKHGSTSVVQKYECTVCDKVFSGPESQKEHLQSQKHLKQVSGKNVTNIKRTPIMTETVENNIQVYKGKPQYDCELCQKTFTGVESQVEHFKSKNHTRKLAENSQQTASTKKDLEVIEHKAARTLENIPNQSQNLRNEGKYECKICAKSFTGIESQQEHFKSSKHFKKLAEQNENYNKNPEINEGENQQFECTICEKSFTGIESKQEHLKSNKHLKKVLEQNGTYTKNPHEEEHGPFECRICEKFFTGIESQDQHLKSSKHLKKVSEQKEAYRKPQLNEGEKQSFECKICEKSFTGIESQEEHLKSKKHLNKCLQKDKLFPSEE